MAPDFSLTHSDNSTSTPPPPPSKQPRQSGRRKKLLIGGASASAVLVLGIGGASIAIASNEQRLDEYEEARDELSTVYSTSGDLLEEAGTLEPESRAAIEEQRAKVDGLFSSPAPSVLSFDIDDRTEALLNGAATFEEPNAALEDAITHRETYTSSTSDAEDTLAEAEDLLETTADKVADDSAYDELASYVTALEEALENEPDETLGVAFADSASAVEEASRNVTGSISTVSDSHDAWQESEKEAAQSDPDNYSTLSERDWLLVERDPDAYEGEQYVLYGAVTQADPSTGEMSIRVNTGPAQQSRQYDYDVNTMVLAGKPDVFANVVQGDHVKMLVEVGGSMTYETTIGGSATAVMTMGYDVEVLGQF